MHIHVRMQVYVVLIELDGRRRKELRLRRPTRKSRGKRKEGRIRINQQTCFRSCRFRSFLLMIAFCGRRFAVATTDYEQHIHAHTQTSIYMNVEKLSIFIFLILFYFVIFFSLFSACFRRRRFFLLSLLLIAFG